MDGMKGRDVQNDQGATRALVVDDDEALLPIGCPRGVDG
jgi:hypothetical protein